MLERRDDFESGIPTITAERGAEGHFVDVPNGGWYELDVTMHGNASCRLVGRTQPPT